MSRPLRVLLVEDSEDDALLVLRALRTGGFQPAHQRVDTPEGMRAALADGAWDIVISDYSMPKFNGPAALKLVQASGLDLPLIIVSGTIGEDVAVTTMQAGAVDYLLKDRLTRLPAAVRHALAEAKEHRRLRQAETRLRESEELFRTAMNSSPIGLALVAPDGRWLRVNPALCRLVGYSEEELLATDFQTITHPDDLTDDLNFVRRMLRREIATYQMEKRYLHKDGSVIWVLLSVSLMSNRDGTPRHFISQIINITERKLAELALRKSEANLLAAQAIARVGSSQYDPATGEWTWSPQLFRIFRLDPARGVPPRDQLLSLVHPDYRDAFLRLYSLDHPAAGRSEFRFQLSDGSTLWTEQSNELIYDPEGRLVSIIGTSIDITERKRMEEALHESEARFQQLAEHSDEVFWFATVNPERITYVSPAVEKIWQIPVARFYADPREWLKALHPDDRLRVQAAYEAVLAGGSPRLAEEYRVMRSDGTVRIVLDTGTPIRGADGSVVSIGGVARDVTERKEAEERLLRVQRLENLGMLAAGIAHDFNNALAPLVMGCPLLRPRVHDPGGQRLLDTMEKSAGRSVKLVHQLLSFARGAAGESQLLQVRHVLDEVLELAKATFPKSIRLTSHLPGELWPVQGNPSQIHQIFLNLFVNARDAMPQGGTLTVTAANTTLDNTAAAGIADARSGSFLVVEVNDTGTGIPPDALARIWEPFFSTKGEGKGTGLGLSTVRGILKQSGGFATVKTGAGHGTAFAIYLPAVVDAAGADTASAHPALARRGAGELILVVDDEEAVSELAATILINHGYRALTAQDGTEAIAVFATHLAEVKLLLTDLQMPILGGAALAGALHRMKPSLPVVAMSGAGSQSSAAHKEFTTAFLAKPFQAETLLSIVRRTLDAPPPA